MHAVDLLAPEWASSPEEACDEWAIATWGALENGASFDDSCQTAFALANCAATCCARASVSPPRVAWRTGGAGTPFSVPFTLSTRRSSRLWIAPQAEVPPPPMSPPGSAAGNVQPEAARAIAGAIGAQDEAWEVLTFKGTNWAGMQADGCVHELWRHNVKDYLDYLAREHFNAVRLPLSAPLLVRAASSGFVLAGRCGEYAGWQLLSMLDDLLRRLAAAGLFVMLDIHTMDYPEHNDGLWCTVVAPDGRSCAREHERPLFKAWRVLAKRFCSHPNVVLADVFNEPYGASWAAWRELVQRLSRDVIHALCDRWVVVAEGVAGNGRWWGENVDGFWNEPIVLSVPDKLMLSVHVYGHGNHPYFHDASFPANMPSVWDDHFGGLSLERSVPILVGEWGGSWVARQWNGRDIPATARWQTALRDYLCARNMSSFCMLARPLDVPISHLACAPLPTSLCDRCMHPPLPYSCLTVRVRAVRHCACTATSPQIGPSTTTASAQAPSSATLKHERRR